MAHLLRTSKTRMAWCEPSALPDSLMMTGAGSMPRSMHTSCRDVWPEMLWDRSLGRGAEAARTDPRVRQPIA